MYLCTHAPMRSLYASSQVCIHSLYASSQVCIHVSRSMCLDCQQFFAEVALHDGNGTSRMQTVLHALVECRLYCMH
jgi:hypothetical protein